MHQRHVRNSIQYSATRLFNALLQVLLPPSIFRRRSVRRRASRCVLHPHQALKSLTKCQLWECQSSSFLTPGARILMTRSRLQNNA